jgi:hypothetical protein
MRYLTNVYLEREREILLEALAYHEVLMRRVYTRLLEIEQQLNYESGATDDLLVPSSIGLEGDLGEVIHQPLQGE